MRGLRIGVPRSTCRTTLDAGVRARIEEALDVARGAGREIDRDVSLPSTEAALAVYYIIAPSEASANLARYDGVKYGFSYQQGDEHVGEHGEDARARLRRRGEAPHHDRHLRALVRLLRRLLPEGAEGAHASSAASSTPRSRSTT